MDYFSFAYVCDGDPCYLAMYLKTVDSALILPLHTPFIPGGDPENQLPTRRYFSFTLEVMDWMTVDAILKASPRPLRSIGPRQSFEHRPRHVRFNSLTLTSRNIARRQLRLADF
jgi:hypothetical protein